MKRVCIIFDHPYEGSFCHALLDAARAGVYRAGLELDIIDLHHEDFDPVLRRIDLATYPLGTSADVKVMEYQRRLTDAQHWVFIFPIWWEVMPALTKGFIDKVLLPGWAFEETGGMTPRGMLGEHCATVITTMGFPHWYYRLHFGNALRGAFLNGTLRFVGIRRRQWFNVGNVARISADRRARHLRRVERHFSQL